MLESLLPGGGLAFRSFDDVDALKSMLAMYFPGHSLDLGSGWREFRARIGVCPLDKMLLFHGAYRGAVRLGVPDSVRFAQGFPIRGAAESVNNQVVTTSSPQRGIIAEPGELRFSTSPDFEHVVTLIEPETLSETFVALIGRSGVGPIRLTAPTAGSRAEAPFVRGLVTTLYNELAAQNSLSPVAVAEMQQAILVALVCGYVHNFSHLLDGPPPRTAPWQTRRVEEYIVANWDQPISIQALAIVANASVRSVFNAFRIHRGYTPMHFVKQVRLKHCREMLSNPNAEMTVTEIAFACGFGNLGHFARDYQVAFGESPSVTLRRAKGTRTA
jgi:AraC-like DNA-binding protein